MRAPRRRPSILAGLVGLSCAVLAGPSVNHAAPAPDVPNLIHLKGHQGYVHHAAFSSDSARLASVSVDQTVRVWDFLNGKEILTLKGHRDQVRGVAFSPDGKLLASCSEDSTVRLWNAATGEKVATLKASNGDHVSGVVFSPDGKRLASAGGLSGAKVWDVATSQLLFTPPVEKAAPGGSVMSVAFSPDGQRLAVGVNKRMDEKGRRIPGAILDVWEVDKGRKLLTMPGHSDRIRQVLFSPNGKYLASAGDDRTVKVWDSTTGKELLTFKEHKGHVFGLAFSPDSKRLASASIDEKLLVWEVETGKVHLRRSDGVYWYVAFSPDGKWLACDGELKVVTVVRLPD